MTTNPGKRNTISPPYTIVKVCSGEESEIKQRITVEETKEINKLETFKKFIGKDQTFDLVITKHEHEGSHYGNHNSEVVNIKDEMIIIAGIGFTGSIMEKLISSITPKNAKISFFDTDGIEIKLSIIKRNA